MRNSLLHLRGITVDRENDDYSCTNQGENICSNKRVTVRYCSTSISSIPCGEQGDNEANFRRAIGASNGIRRAWKLYSTGGAMAGENSSFGVCPSFWLSDLSSAGS